MMLGGVRGSSVRGRSAGFLVAALLASLALAGFPAVAGATGKPLIAQSVSSGDSHSCAVATSGQALCWGYNLNGQIGDGTSGGSGLQRFTPTLVDRLTDAVAISAGGSHTCAVRESGQALCWGNNSSGQLGDGSTTQRLVPVPVEGLTDAVSISAGGGHTCAVRESGQAVCWGWNGDGRLGDGSTTQRLTPTPVTGLDDAVSISVGTTHTCAIRESGQAVCWGANGSGWLGDGTTTQRLVPTTVDGLTDAVAISTGAVHTCAVRESGQAVCWGSNGQGRLGDGTNTGRLTPTPVTGLADAASIVAGGSHTCAIRETGQALCWGLNTNGRLGDGTTDQRLTPTPVAPRPFTLSVTLSGFGDGVVTSDPAGIDCGEGCDANFVDGTAVTLTVDPAEGSGFAGWSGACEGTGECVVTVDQIRQVEAGFDAPPPDWPATSVSAGGGHTCSIWESGQVACWGNNANGQIGDGSTTYRLIPARVEGLTDAVAIAAGQQHTCAIRESGQAVCWGYNFNGQLGDGTSGTVAPGVVAQRLTPTPVEGLTDAVAISAGEAHTCAVRESGQAVCWGDNFNGQVGDGTTTQRLVPTPVEGLTDAVSISAGSAHSCAIRESGQAVCWGLNSNGQLGDGTTAQRLVPTPVDGLTDAVSIAAAVGVSRTCAVRESGQAVCWGNNTNGLLGDGTNTQRVVPTPVTGLADAVAITASNDHTCVVRESGQAACWGSNFVGKIGDGTSGDIRPMATKVVGLRDATAIAAGGNHTCAIRQPGRTLCWGARAAVGDGTTSSRQVPNPVSGLTNGAAITANQQHTCALNESGGAACWGSNISGRLGDGTTTQRLEPSPVSSLTDGVAITAGRQHTCALRESGQAVCWGNNGNGRLGDGTTTQRSVPTQVTGLTDAIAIAAGGDSTTGHTCAVRESGQAVCWGSNGSGRLGDGTTTQRLAPTPVDGLTDAVSIAAGSSHTCAVRESGHAVCWGYNGYGQLGDGTTTQRLVPTAVDGLTDAVAISAGEAHTCAIRQSGQAVCWGTNTTGRLGDGTTTQRLVPTPVSGLTDAVEIAAGGDLSAGHTCAIRESGQAVCWGANGGRLGDGTGTQRLVPTPVMGLTDAVAIAAGVEHSCAVRETGEARCWGFRGDGRLGDGTTQYVLAPAPISPPPFPLSVTRSGSGDGSVTSEPAGIECGLVCEAEFVDGTEVTLTAGPDQGSGFAGWSGACEGTGDCVVTVDELTEVNAEFDAPPPNLPATSVSVGSGHACASWGTGRAACWGNNAGGWLGDGSTTQRLNPTPVSSLTGAVSVSAGDSHTCAIRQSGQAVCWGANGGRLGDGTTTLRLTPTPVTGLDDAVSISAGSAHTCAIRQSGQAVCWGANGNGRLGDGTTDQRLTPTPVEGLTDAVAIAAGQQHTCAVRESGQAVCWGYNFNGQIGDGTSGAAAQRLTPTPVDGLDDAATITAGSAHTCAIRDTGQALCWGSNSGGQVGDDSAFQFLVPTPVVGLADALAISAGLQHTCAIRQSGQTVCWGINTSGQLGDGSTTQRLLPVPVVGLHDATAIAASRGNNFTCAIRESGRLRCWGLNNSGQLGDGSTTNQSIPTPVSPGPVEHILTVAGSGEGEGTVTSDPAGIDCGVTCEDYFVEGTEVTLTATAESGSTFEGWTGCDSVNGDECAITINGDATVTADFGLEPVDPIVPFNLELNHGVLSLGSAATDSAVTGTVALEGTLDTDTGQVTVPSENVSDITADLPGVDGSVTFRPNGTHVAGAVTANGRVTLHGPFRANFTVDGLSCRATQNFQFSTDRTVPYRGTRFAGGIEGAGAVVVAWEDLGGIRGDAGCEGFASQLSAAGAIWLSHDIAPPVLPVGPLELTPPVIVDSSGGQASQITPGRRLICLAGTWDNVTRGTFAWEKDGQPFSNLKPDGAGSDYYRTTPDDLGSTFRCRQVMRNDKIKDVAGSWSNAATVVPHG